MVPVKVTLLFTVIVLFSAFFFLFAECFCVVIKPSRVAGTIWKHILLLFVLIVMSATESFISEPSVSGLRKLKRAELVDVASHYKLSCSGSLKKDELRWKILQHLHDEELISEDEGDELETDRTTLELKNLEFQENERARENAKNERVRIEGKGVGNES